MDEFSLVERYFSSCGVIRPEVVLGIGDDAAIVSVPSSYQQVISTDTLVEGRHFSNSDSARSIGHKSLAVNLSDLAAMAAQPLATTLSLTLPTIDTDWVSQFSDGFCGLATQHQVQLIGGDVTQGPLSITVQIIGQIKQGHALLRSTARPGDEVYVSGNLGDAALALGLRHGSVSLADGVNLDLLNQALDQPNPRNELGLALDGLATSAIDVSDGLISDLEHVCKSSGCGVKIKQQQIPLSESYRDYLKQGGDWALALTSGDDYELCFTAPAGNQSSVYKISNQLNLKITQVGKMDSGQGVRVYNETDTLLDFELRGYRHFEN